MSIAGSLSGNLNGIKDPPPCPSHKGRGVVTFFLLAGGTLLNCYYYFMASIILPMSKYYYLLPPLYGEVWGRGLPELQPLLRFEIELVAWLDVESIVPCFDMRESTLHAPFAL